MKLKDKYKNDITFIMSKKHVNGADLWAGEDAHIAKAVLFQAGMLHSSLSSLVLPKKTR